jgi:hypothetical protein
MRHPSVLRFEAKLKEAFDQIDHELEATYGHRYPRQAVRPESGVTGNPEMDGLFNVGAAYSVGYGSQLGEGYLVDVRMATWATVPAAEQEEIEARVVERLRDLLPIAFPGRHLAVDRDGHVFKIYGDLSLGAV